MKITLQDLQVMLDTLTGSLRIADGVGMFKFDADTRERVANKILQEMSKVSLTVEDSQ